MPRRSWYLGRWIRHGPWVPDLKLRLFDRRRGRWGGQDPHDRVVLVGAEGLLRGEILHYPYRSFAEHLATIDRYTTLMADSLHRSGRRARPWDLVLRPAVRFVRAYFLKAGWRDGWRVQSHSQLPISRLLDPSGQVKRRGSLIACERARIH